MAIEQQKNNPSNPSAETEQKNGHSGQAHFPPGQQEAAQRETHDGVKYAPPKKEDTSGDQNGDGKKSTPPRKKLLFGIIAAAVFILVLIWGLKYYSYSQIHVSTDDAYVTGNLVNISPNISGTLVTLTVQAGDYVHKGELIARLDTSGPLASLRQARAAYQAAESEIPQAQTNLAYEQKATAAAIQGAQAGLAAQNAKIAGAQQQVTLSQAQSENQVRQARSQILQANAQYQQALAQASSAQAAVTTQRQAVLTAQQAANAAAAQVAAAQANAIKAAQDNARYAQLLKEQAVTPQQYDATLAAQRSTQAQLAAAQSQAAQAKSQVKQAQTMVGVRTAEYNAAVRQAQAVSEQGAVAQANLGLAKANLIQVPIQRSNVANTMGQAGQAQADLATAQAGASQIALRHQQILTAHAQVLQAKAAMQNAMVQYQDCFLYAPTSGAVVTRAVDPGAALSPGQTVVTMTQGSYVWVTANFKETQLTSVRPGEDAKVQVDSYPGKTFLGYVQSISEATGAATALLPPDNATGNFTKVVQRIPVRIELYPVRGNDHSHDANVAEIDRLRQGMSVTATINTSIHSGKRYQKYLNANNGRPIGGSQAAANNYGQGWTASGSNGSSGG